MAQSHIERQLCRPSQGSESKVLAKAIYGNPPLTIFKVCDILNWSRCCVNGIDGGLRENEKRRNTLTNFKKCDKINKRKVVR